MSVLNSVSLHYDANKETYLDLKKLQLSILKQFMDDICKQNSDGTYHFVRTKLDKDPNAILSYAKHFPTIRKHFKYDNWYNLLSSPRKIRNLLTFMCRSLMIPINVKIKNFRKPDGKFSTFRQNTILVA